MRKNTVGSQVSKKAPSICAMSQSRMESGMPPECRVKGKEGNSGRVVVGTSLGGRVYNRENGVAAGRIWNWSVVIEQLFSRAEERDARPIDELGEIFLGVDQRIVVSLLVPLETGHAAATKRLDPRYVGIWVEADCPWSSRGIHGNPYCGSVQIL